MSDAVILYNTEDGGTQLRLKIQDGTVWLTQAEMADLFQTTKQNVSLHLKTIFRDAELAEASVVKDHLTTAADGKSYQTRHYRLEAILAVGYRVRSPRGSQFRRWATTVLRDYLIKGFAIDDARLKDPAAGLDYFDELLERIREIRASEKRFYQKVRDLFATAVDYDKTAETARRFFQTIQNKMLWAVTGHTAAELILDRADPAVLTHAGSVSHENMLKIIDQRYATFDAARRQADQQAAEVEYEQDVDAELRALEATTSRAKKQARKGRAS